MFQRFPIKDPRTIAREIPGIFDMLFPQLTAGSVAYFNRRQILQENIKPIPDDVVSSGSLQHAMLFEIAFARAEQLLKDARVADWDSCIDVAFQRQSRHFDAKLPVDLMENDLGIADWAGQNLFTILDDITSARKQPLISSPMIPGYQWIASGNGDFALGKNLIEVKFTSRNFGSADYRQVLIYWLLSFSSMIENNGCEWKNVILINPRFCRILDISFDELIAVFSGGRNKIEILELFNSIIGDYSLAALPEFRF